MREGVHQVTWPGNFRSIMVGASQRHSKRAARGRKQALAESLAVAAHIALTGDRGIDRLPLAIMSEFHTGRDRQHLGETASGAIDAAFHGPDRGAANPRRLFVG